MIDTVPDRRRRRLLVLYVFVLLTMTLSAAVVYVQTRIADPAPATPPSAAGSNAVPATVEAAGWSREACVYSAHSRARLERFQTAVGRTFDCALVFTDTAPSWPDWTDPWFLRADSPDIDWLAWTREDPDRRLVISIGMAPRDSPADWRARGAAGEYDIHARALARRLVFAGLGDSVLRIGHEGNGHWFPHWFGETTEQRRDWTGYWRNMAQALQSVPGAAFVLDWSVAPGVDDVDLASYYPGDDVVDVIGYSLHDFDAQADAPVAGDRFARQYYRDNGPSTIAAFAAAHSKPLSLSEWGLIADRPGRASGAGDNPAFVTSVAAVVRDHPVAYHGIFLGPGVDPEVFLDAPRSIQAYREEFGS